MVRTGLLGEKAAALVSHVGAELCPPQHAPRPETSLHLRACTLSRRAGPLPGAPCSCQAARAVPGDSFSCCPALQLHEARDCHAAQSTEGAGAPSALARRHLTARMDDAKATKGGPPPRAPIGRVTGTQASTHGWDPQGVRHRTSTGKGPPGSGGSSEPRAPPREAAGSEGLALPQAPSGLGPQAGDAVRAPAFTRGPSRPAPTADNESKREEALHSLHEALQRTPSACADARGASSVPSAPHPTPGCSALPDLFHGLELYHGISFILR